MALRVNILKRYPTECVLRGVVYLTFSDSGTKGYNGQLVSYIYIYARIEVCSYIALASTHLPLLYYVYTPTCKVMSYHRCMAAVRSCFESLYSLFPLCLKGEKKGQIPRLRYSLFYALYFLSFTSPPLFFFQISQIVCPLRF